MNNSFKQKNKLKAIFLVTVAYNEEKQIERTLRCVIQQTILPKQWLIVSDGSTDGTDAIIKRYAAKYPWIKDARREKTADPHQKLGKASYAYARSMALARKEFAKIPHEFVANLDADITFGPDYYEKVMEKALSDEKIGITGGGGYSVLENGK